MANRTNAAFTTNIASQFPTNGTGQIPASRVRIHLGQDIPDSFLNRNDDLLDEDDMASDSATKVPSQQSVKAFVASQITTFTSGTYTPTLRNGTNVAASTAPNLCYYHRVGSVVTVAGWVTCDVTAAATTTNLGVSLPVASNFSDTFQASGYGLTAIRENISIISDQTNDEVTLIFVTATTSNQAIQFNFTYRII